MTAAPARWWDRTWDRFWPRRRIGTRVVAAVTLATTVLLVLAGAFVFWRVSYALNRQLNQDLRAYAEVAQHAVSTGAPLPSGTPGEATQVYATDGSMIGNSNAGIPRLVSRSLVASMSASVASRVDSFDTVHLLAPARHAYRVRVFISATSQGARFVVAAAISQQKHDEALRELLLQLALTDLIVIAASGFVGYGAARAALGPVEAYRRAADAAGEDPSERLPVALERDDELTRLGVTFNHLLDRIAQGHARERGFLADASHELRSPIALLAAEVEWARHRPRSPAEMDVVLTSVQQAIKRLASLSDNLLDLEELRGTPTHSRVTLPLDELIALSVAPHRAALAEHERSLSIEGASDEVYVDPHWMALAIGNLVGNALKHGAGKLTVTASVAAGVARIVVLDEGPGIPEELGDRAFDRFTRGDASRTTRGNGLGLALVKAVTEEHGGSQGLLPGGVWLEFPAGR